MWTRKQLKEKGKVSFRANYWRAVLVALIIAFVVGGGVSLSGSSSLLAAPSTIGVGGMTNPNTFNSSTTESPDDIDDIINRLDGESTAQGRNQDPQALESLKEELEGYGINAEDLDNANVSVGRDGIHVESDDGTSVHIDGNGIHVESGNGDSVHLDAPAGDAADMAIIAGLTIAFLLILLIAFVIAFAVDAFLLNPIEVGARRFFLCNLNRQAEVKEVMFGFDHNYLNNVKTMFFRDLFTFLWSLLFIIPGIVKSYEYRMIPYLIAENPEIDRKAAFAASKQMMYGHKWNTFVLDLSFIGWWLLSAITLGIVGIFYVGPYYAATSAALYEALRYGGEQADPVEQVVPSNDPFTSPAVEQPFNAPSMSDQPAWARESATDTSEPHASPTNPKANASGDFPVPPEA